MKIADVAEFYAEQGGGVKTYVRQKLAACAALGHEAIIIAPGAETRIENVPGGRIRWIKSPKEPLDPRYHRFADEAAVHALLDAEQPDVVEGSSLWKGGQFAASWPGSAFKCLIMHQDPIAVYPHTLLDRWISPNRIDQMFGFFWRKVSRLAARYDMTLTAGQWLTDRLTRFGIPNAVTVPFGIDKHAFSPTKASQELRRELLAECGVNHPDAKLILTISRHHPEKRLGTVLKAFSAAAQQQPMGLYLIGDGPISGWVKRRAAQVPHVKVAGLVRERERLAALMASADALLHGGAAETYGLVVAEAVCSGLPLVVPDRGGAVELSRPSFAETYPPGNVPAATAALQRLLARDRPTLTQAALAEGASAILTPIQHFERLFAHYDRARKKK